MKTERNPGAMDRRVEETRLERQYVPYVDILDKGGELVLKVDLPGVDPGNLDLHFEDGTLSLHGKVKGRQPENVKWIHREYGVGDFRRSFQIGEAIEVTKISAEYRDGVAIIHLPKTEEVQPRKIPVHAG